MGTRAARRGRSGQPRRRRGGGGPGARLRLCVRRGAAMNAAVVKRTQEAPGQVIRRPPLTEAAEQAPVPLPARHHHGGERRAGIGTAVWAGVPVRGPGAARDEARGCCRGRDGYVNVECSARRTGSARPVWDESRTGLGGSDQSWRRIGPRVQALPLPSPASAGRMTPGPPFGSVRLLGSILMFSVCPLLSRSSLSLAGLFPNFFPCSVWQMGECLQIKEKGHYFLVNCPP